MEILIKNQQKKVKTDKKKVLNILRKIGKLLCLETTEVSIVFVNDRKSRELNIIYLGIDRPTDVISFPMFDSTADCKLKIQELQTLKSATQNLPDVVLLGDIVINLHKTVRQAREHCNTFYGELTFLLVHGLLHLIGYNHMGNSYQARKMRKKELEIIRALEEMG